MQLKNIRFDSDKVLCVVRNPLDSIISFATLSNTLSHAADLEFKVSELYPEWWAWWVKYICDQQTQFFEKLVRHCTLEGLNPIYIVRYEDLCLEPADELEGMMKFLLDLDSLEGTNAARRIEQLKSLGDKSTSTYQLKRNPRAFNQSDSCYNPELKAYVAKTMQKWIHFFGYNEHVGNEKTGFFKYTEAEAASNEQHYYGFRKTNEAALKNLVAE